MAVQDEDITKGIYKAKFMKTLDTLERGYAGLTLAGFVCFFIWRFFCFMLSFFSKNLDEVWVPNEWETFILFYVIAGLLFLLSCALYYFREINCWVEFDGKELYITGYYRGKKIDQSVYIEFIEYAYWEDNFFSYENQKYRGVTLVTLDGKKIKNIPVEYKSDLYNYFRTIVRYDF